MAYNKKQHYQDNITAIRVAFNVDKNGLPPKGTAAYNGVMDALSKYSGFGGLKCVLNDSLDPADWAEYERDLIPLQKELFEVIKENSADDSEYYNYIASIRSSVLSAFYTPSEVVSAISETIAESGINIETMLEPSAGSGVFVNNFNDVLPIKEGVAVEKDILTGKILKHLESSDTQTVLVQGFENLPTKYENHFDLVVSNIPFGNYRVFDSKLMDTPQRKFAQEAIHNYFFVKGLDACKDGGLVAFITSQGVADSPQNKLVRQYLMDNADLVSAVRLPNNLFADHAGTEVGTDLIVLKKNDNKVELSSHETLFVNTTKIDAGGGSISENSYFNDAKNRSIHTHIEYGKDQYGKPARVRQWRDDFSKLKDELKSKLFEDFSKNLAVSFSQPQQAQNPHWQDRERLEELDKITDKFVSDLENVKSNLEQPAPQMAIPTPSKSGQLNMFELFDFSEPEVAQVQEQQEQEAEPTIQPLFDVYSFPADAIFPHHREGSLATMDIEGHGRVLGTLSSIERDEHLHSAIFNVINDKKTLKNTPFLLDYIKLRDAYETLYQSEVVTKQENHSWREGLNEVYDRFVLDWGAIQKNKDIIKIDSTYLAVLSLEKIEGEEIKKADIFFEPTAFDNKPLETVESAQDALICSLNKHGFPYIPFMEEVFPQQEIDATIDELVKSNMLYYNVENDSYETKDRYLSGNMYEKYDRQRHFYDIMPAGEKKDYVRKGLNDIRSSIPQPIAFDNIGIQIGERWLPTKLYEQFAVELFDCGWAEVGYQKSIDEFVVKIPGFSSEYFVDTGANRSNLHAQDLFKHALDSTRPEVTKSVLDKKGKTVSVPDFQKQQLANVKVEQIKEKFEQFLLRLPAEEKQFLQDDYNRRFNGNVRPQYDGSHQTFPELRLDNHQHAKELYQSQKNAIWMLKQNGGGVIDHEVGGGTWKKEDELKTLKNQRGELELKLQKEAHSNKQDNPEEAKKKGIKR